MNKEKLLKTLKLPCSLNDLREALFEYFKEEDVYAIGLIFEYEDKKIKVVESQGCQGCIFADEENITVFRCNQPDNFDIACTSSHRYDNKYVKFVEVKI